MKIDIKYVIIIVVLLIIIAYLLIAEPNNFAYHYNAGFLDPGGTADRLCNAWCGRMSGAVILCLLTGAGYYYYDYKVYEINAATEIEIERIAAEAEQTKTLARPREKTRIIPFSASHTKLVHAGQIQLTDSLTMQKQDLIQFITESTRPDGIGLAISRWKNDMGWDQGKVESLLDYFASIGLVTDRTPGKACSYTGGFSAPELLKVISENAVEIG